MNHDWTHSDIGQRVLSYALDPRPVWFWNEDGSVLIWRNLAAKLFRSKFKKKGLKFLPDPEPLKGQVSRLIKLGSYGRASVSRMRFRMGKKPVSATCSCIPFKFGKKQKGLLVISSDAIDLAQFDGNAFTLVADEQLFEPAQDYAILDINNNVVAAAVASGEQDDLDALLKHSTDKIAEAAYLDAPLKAGATLLMLDLDKLAAAEPIETEVESAPDEEDSSDDIVVEQPEAMLEDAPVESEPSAEIEEEAEAEAEAEAEDAEAEAEAEDATDLSHSVKSKIQTGCQPKISLIL